jgi:hypothetical protein
VGGEHLGLVGTLARDLLPQIVLDEANVNLAFEYSAQPLALSIVGDTGELDCRNVVPRPSGFQRFDNPFSPADADEIAYIKLGRDFSRPGGSFIQANSSCATPAVRRSRGSPRVHQPIPLRAFFCCVT